MAAVGTNHAAEAERLVGNADYIANADRWPDSRGEDVANQARLAQVHATLAVADRLDALLAHLEDHATTVRGPE